MYQKCCFIKKNGNPDYLLVCFKDYFRLCLTVISLKK